ncbi:hypothetical protein [Streptomyces sp. G-5]|uniref:hypothetical protein n=1 Tax=Streptomyces sp. G-5 TaxID=2977231 RepID=UPI0021D27197|nr:hypothetical protein [Streptomyces sp. G-5]MCU4750223.1 hypothetical protein [Streptomyces sp. G-5]
MPPRTPKALAAWSELNDRQQGTLAVIYDLDQGAESARRRSAAQGYYDARPASEWRQIAFAHDPSERRLLGVTEMQSRLAARGWDNQGNGSTVAALATRKLITRSQYGTPYGVMLTVALTRAGRAAARAGLSLHPDGARTAALGYRSWQVLALLWAADQQGLPWTHSTTIERVLIDKHVPPLAEAIGNYRGYRITDRGRDFYRTQYAAHTAAHPDVHAPHPLGPDAEPWPKKADELLKEHRRVYRALTTAWREADAARRAAEEEAASPARPVPAPLPAALIEQFAARHRLLQDTARQRADLAAGHAEELAAHAERAARAYAAATLAALRAATSQSNPLVGIEPPPATTDGWDEPHLAPPEATGIHAIDAEVKRLYAVAIGKPLPRRGPAPKRRRHWASLDATAAAPPGQDHAALAGFLFEHLADGALLRRLHPPTPPAPTRAPAREEAAP